jgi:hypothetical protein
MANNIILLYTKRILINSFLTIKFNFHLHKFVEECTIFSSYRRISCLCLSKGNSQGDWQR